MGTRIIKREITIAEYNRYMEMPKAEQRQEIELLVPREWYMGYGYYGYNLIEQDDKYYIAFKVGTSCD